jgi:hypothetical protein
MELLAVSKDTIRTHVIRYFHDVFHTPVSAFKPGTNVRNAYSYSDRAWSQLANIFNKLSWMRQLGVLLSPREMPGLNTIEDLTSAIWGRQAKVISVTGLSPRFVAARVRKLTAPKRAAKSKRKAAAKSKRKTPKRAARKKTKRLKPS